jgi:hypothetical protein
LGNPGGKGPKAFVPTLWSRAFQAKEPDGSCFIPLVVEIESRLTDNLIAFMDIRGTFSRLLRNSAGQQVDFGGQASTGIPADFPMPQTMSDGFVSMDISASASGPLGEGGLRPKDRKGKLAKGIRANFPVPSATLDTNFVAKEREPSWAPEPKLRERITGEPEKEPLVIVAVIDDGLPFAHHNLRDRNRKSRMEFCWLQSAEFEKTEENGKERPNGVLFGREHTRDAINGLIGTYGQDEDELYRAAGALVGAGRRGHAAALVSHGAHVLDLAAGHRHGRLKAGNAPLPGDGDLDRMRLIGVELPSPLMMDTVGFGKDAYILSAFHYVFDRADRIAAGYGQENAHLIINFSFGFTGGPHDGNDRLEQAIQEMIQARPNTRLVMPAGNHFSSRLHSEISAKDLDAEGMATVYWRLQPNDRTSNYLEIWLPSKGDALVSLMATNPHLRSSGPRPSEFTITGPRGSQIAFKEGEKTPEAEDQFIWQVMKGGQVIGQASLDNFRSIHWRLMVILAPTEPNDPGLPAAPAGCWKVRFKADMIKGSRDVVTCRIQRDTDPTGALRGAKQSYFDHPDYDLFDATGALARKDDPACPVKRFGTLNGLATHRDVIVVGGVVGGTHSERLHEAGMQVPRPAEYSSAGPLPGPPQAGGQVDCAAVSDDSPLLRGRRAAGLRSGSCGRLLGTSAAAPQVTRAIALAYLSPARASGSGVGSKPHGTIKGTDVAGLRMLDWPDSPLFLCDRARLGDGVLLPPED